MTPEQFDELTKRAGPICRECEQYTVSNPAFMSPAALGMGAAAEVVGVKLCTKHTALEERLQSEQKDRRLIAEALDRVAKEKITLEGRLRQAEECIQSLISADYGTELVVARCQASELLDELNKQGTDAMNRNEAQEKHIAELVEQSEHRYKWAMAQQRLADLRIAQIEARDEQIAKLDAELVELNNAYKRTRLASAEKHEQILRLRSMSTVEMMCENDNVRAHVEEWEQRCLKAEKQVQYLLDEWVLPDTRPMAEEALAQTEEKSGQ